MMKTYPLAKVKTLSGAPVHGGEEFSSQTSFPKHDLLTKDTLHNETSNTAIQRAGGILQVYSVKGKGALRYARLT